LVDPGEEQEAALRAKFFEARTLKKTRRTCRHDLPS